MTTAKFKAQRILSWILLCGAILFSVTIRYRLAAFPMDRDEGEYAYAGQLLLKGIPPYQFAHNMKLPGTYFAYAALMSVFGQTTEGVHLGMLMVNLATIMLLYVLVRRLFDELTAGAAALIYAILSVSAPILGMTAHATHFVAYFGVAGSISLWNCLRTSDWRRAIGSGLLFGLAFLMKQQGVFLIAFGGVYLFERIVRDDAVPRFQRTRDFALYSAGAVTPYILVCMWLWSAGVWEQFKFWTIEYAAQYVQVISLPAGISLAIQGTLIAIGANVCLWLLALLGLIRLLDEILSRSRAVEHSLAMAPVSLAKLNHRFAACWFVGGYVVFSAMCVLPGLIFRSQYYVVMLPPLAILGGVGCRIPELQEEHSLLKNWWHCWWNSSAALIDDMATQVDMNQPVLGPSVSSAEQVRSSRLTASFRSWFLPALVLAIAVVPTVLFQFNYFFWLSPHVLCRQIYGTNPFPESQVIADYLRDHTESSDTIAVVGSEPQLYFLSQRRSSTGYIYTYPLVEPQPFARRMQEEMIHEIEQDAPAFIVDVQISMSWARRNSETLIFDWKNEYLKRHYRCVGIVDIVPKKGTVFRWNREVESYLPKSDNLILVYKRT